MTNPRDTQPILSVRGLKVYFPIRKGLVGTVVDHVRAVDGIDFDVERQEVFALVGESGCGKTTAAHAALGLVTPTAGDVQLAVGAWKDHPISWLDLKGAERRAIRKHVQIVFQDPFSSLDPRTTVLQILEEPLILHNVENRQARIDELLGQVGLSRSFLNRYPHEFSGGQRQRIGIARALATKPELVIADEPVSALDVSIQAQIINLLDDLRKEYQQSLLFISHDLAVVRHLAHRVAVMYLGKIMEKGSSDQIYHNAQHPYTHLLLQSIPIPGKGRTNRKTLPTEEKGEAGMSAGCPFYARCPQRVAICKQEMPELKNLGDGHLVACHRR